MELKSNPFVPYAGEIPRGISVASDRPLTFHQIIVRGNIVRLSGADHYSDQQPLGIFLQYCDNGLVENNIIGIEAQNPIYNDRGPLLEFFNNREPNGNLLRGRHATFTTLLTQSRELADEIDDAVTLALLKRRT